MEIAKRFNEEHLVWAVGGSLMLYLNGIVSDFEDIDVFVSVEHAPIAQSILESLGSKQLTTYSDQFQTVVYETYRINSVSVDLMAGFKIVHEKTIHDCSLTKKSLIDFTYFNQHILPLWNVNTLTDNFYSYIDWAYETGDLYPSDECNLSLLYHQICPPNSLCNCSSVSNLFWYTNSNFKLLKFASATALS